jgi:hypothetical protein
MASNDITIVDYKIGTSSQGFKVRVGEAPPLVKMASYLGHKSASGSFTDKTYSTFKEAYDAAVEFRNREKPTYKVRADCTLS